MVTTEPACKPPMDRSAPHEGSLWQRPAVQVTLRALSVVAGAVGSLAAFVIVGLYAVLEGCDGTETHGLCVNYAGLVPVLEWPIFVIAALTPLAGGIAGCVTRRPRWLVAGVAVAVVMFALMSLVSTGQTQYELFT